MNSNIKEKFNIESRVLVTLFGMLYIWYCCTSMIELPHMTWFDQYPLADRWLSGQLQIGDLFSKYGEHGLLANNILWLINVTFFHGTTLFDVWLNIVNVILSTFILIYCTLKIVDKSKWNVLWIGAEALFMFICTQASSGGMETQVRLGLLLSIITFILLDEEFKNREITDKKHFILTLVTIVLSVNVFGTLYTFAGVPLVWLIVIFECIRHKQIIKKHLIIAGTYLGTIVAYVVEYDLISFFQNNSSGEGGGIVQNLIAMVMHPVITLECFFSWCANGVFGWAYYSSPLYNSTVWLAMGALVFIIICLSIVFFFNSRMYEKTWTPLLCIVYSFGVLVMVYLGRAGTWEWFANEWYTVHVKVALVGAICIYAYVFKRNNKIKIFSIVSVVFLCILGSVGNYCAVNRAEDVHNYYAGMQKYLYVNDKEEMPVDEISGNTPLLHSLDATMNSIEIMKKYNLSVYQYWNAYIECPTTVISNNEIKYLSGWYDDGWVEKNSTIELYTKNASRIRFSYTSLQQQNVKVIINGVELEDLIKIEVGESYFDIPCSPGEQLEIELQSDTEFELSPPDERICSYLISDVERIE